MHWTNAAAALLLGGCPGNGTGLDANGDPRVPGSRGGGPLTADAASIQENVFTPVCSPCHSGVGAPQGLRLDSANSYDLLVGVPSTEVPGILRVKAGDPVNSYLMQKLEGHAAVGARMPFGGPYLSADVIAVVAQWIADGALRSSAAAIAAPFALVTSAPASGEILQEPPPQIMLGFNHDLDLTRLGPGVVHLDWVGKDQANPSAGIVPARVTAPPGNSRVLLLWPASRLPHAQYRLMLRAGSSGIADIGGASPASGPGDPALSDESTETPLITFEIEGAP